MIIRLLFVRLEIQNWFGNDTNDYELDLWSVNKLKENTFCVTFTGTSVSQTRLHVDKETQTELRMIDIAFWNQFNVCKTQRKRL